MAYRSLSPAALKRLRLFDEDDWSFGRESMDVIVQDDDPVDTGLVDQHGNKIMRLPDRAPMGFCRSRD